MIDAKQFGSLAGFLEHFKDEQTCRQAFEKIRFRNGEYCPHCGCAEIYRFSDGKRYRCKGCKQDFSIKTGTVFGESKLSLRQWFIAIYLLTTCRKGISSVQLAKQVGVTQKTAWFMDHRIRKAMKETKGQLFGTIEADETYVGGKAKNKHASKRKACSRGRDVQDKTPVFGLIRRADENGRSKVRAVVLGDVKMRTIEKHVIEHVALGSKIYTDDFPSYDRVKLWFHHEKVKHALGEYVREGGIHSNCAESFWALFKRGYVGIYHWMSRKHLQRYVDEFAYRFNSRDAEFPGVFSDMVERVAETGKLPYKVLTA